MFDKQTFEEAIANEERFYIDRIAKDICSLIETLTKARALITSETPDTNYIDETIVQRAAELVRWATSYEVYSAVRVSANQGEFDA